MAETSETKQVSRAASSLLFPELEFDIASNGTYLSEDFLEVLAQIAFDNGFANAGAKAYQLSRGADVDVGTESRNPLVRALLYCVRGLDADAVDGQFDRVRDAVLGETARNRLFTRPVDVAIDLVKLFLLFGNAFQTDSCGVEAHARLGLRFLRTEFQTDPCGMARVLFATIGLAELYEPSAEPWSASRSSSRRHCRPWMVR